MKAKYLGLQEQFGDRPPMILVNVKREFGLSTEVFSSQKHKLSKKDTKKIMKDLKEWREQREQDSINMFYSELENVVGKID